MVSGCVCGSNFKIGSGFNFVVENYSTGTVSVMTAKCAELGAYYGTYNFYGLRANNTAPGGIITLKSASGDCVGTSPNWGTGNITISECDFCEVSSTVSGSGSVTIGGTAYNVKYRKQGDSILITATPAKNASGSAYTHKLKKLLVNGSTVNLGSYTRGVFTYTISSISSDTSIVAYFVPTSYTVTCNEPSGGTVSFTKNGEVATVPFTANVDEVIVCTATPDSDKMVQNFAVDGTISSGGSTGVQNFSFTIYEREDDATYNCSVTFCDRAAVTDSVVGKSDGETDDAVVTCNEEEVARSSTGSFMAYTGNTYTATAATPTNFRSYDGWKNTNGEIVSTEYSYSWTQASNAVSIVASYTDKDLYTENFYVGTSTSDYGTGGTAYLAGCRAEITRQGGTTKDGKWLGGSRTVSATTIPDDWTFSGVYVSDTSASGGTKYYKANGASSVTFESACDANIYAIFASDEEVAPEDADQGNSTIATETSASGISIWEGADTNMTMTWLSKMYVAAMPMTISTARVYADGYKTDDTNDVKFSCLLFQSPDSTDSKVVETTAKSQNAYRTPMRRPEKYIELEVSAPHQVTQIAVATGMEALWQA